MTITRKSANILITAIEFLCLATIAVVASRWFLFADACKIVIAFTAAATVPLAAFKRSRHYSRAGELFLLLAAMTVILLAISHIYRITILAGHPFDSPLLQSDDGRYFKWALSVYDGRVPRPACTFVGLPLIMVGLWKVLGVSVVWPLALNVLATLSAIVITARMAVEILRSRVNVSATTITAVSIAACAGLFFFLSQTARVQKEAMTYLATALVGLALARFTNRERLDKATFWLFVAGCVIMSLVRTGFVYFFAIGIFICFLPKWRVKWKPALLLLAVTLVIFLAGCYLSFYSFNKQLTTIAGGDGMDRSFVITGNQQPYLALIGKYFYYSIFKRLMLLPLTMSVQFIIPFPWVYEQEFNGSVIVEIITRLRWMWYAVGGIALYYYLFVAWHKNEGIGVWAWWPAAIFVIIAYVIGGSVSRYVLPFQILFIPQALYVIFRLKEGEYRKSFTLWAIAYVMILACTLMVCYNIQTNYLNDLDRYYRSVIGQ